MAGPEKNLYKMVKDKLSDFNPIRIFDGVFILQRVPSSREVFLYRSIEIDFLDPKWVANPCARAVDRENWCALSAQLNSDPLDVVGAPLKSGRITNNGGK